MPSTATKVVFNPGALAPRQLFRSCDLIVEFENSISAYRNGGANIKSISSDYRSHSAVLVHGFPLDINAAGLVNTMKRYGFGAVCFTADCCYDEVDQGLLGRLPEAVLIG